MQQASDRLFRSYQKRRDPELLARVFDLTAPGLLRLAVHLVGDVAEAEDLVQSTFVAAIERADAFQGKGSAQAWLTAILTHKASDVRRSSTRQQDAKVLIEREAQRAVATPLDAALEAESSGALSKALDSLNATYRAPLILRLRHGMTIADIAHVLELSPGAVRVRLSRGTEKLRQSLPAGLASAAWLVPAPERGLSAVRASVLPEAARVAVAGTSTPTLGSGGLLMTKKVLFGCAAVLLALAGRAWLHLDSSPSEAEVALAPAAESPSSARAPGHRLSASVPAPSAQADRTAAAEPPSTQLGVPGRVFDAETGEPLAGVLVKAFAPEELLYSELKKRASPYLAQSPWNGEVRAFATWPRLDAELTEAQRLDVDPVVAWTRPEQGQVALATAISDAAGRFQLSVPPGGATLVCELAGYGPRCLPLTSSDLKALDANAGIVLAMRTPGRLSGQVIDVQGRPVDEELELVFWGAVQGTDDQGAELHHDSSTESWSASTAPDGSFDLHLPSATVSARARTPGYLVRQTGFHPDHQQPWVFDTVFEPGRPNACPFGLDHSPYIVVERVPVLHVTDASSGVGVEHVQMIGRELANGRVYSAGRYFAPGGQLPLIDDSRRNSEVAEMDLELLIWAPGYRASRVRLFADVLKQQAVPVALEPGELPALAGRVLAAGQPLEGVKVALQPYGKSPWRIEDGGAAQVVRTDASGSFALRAPAGAYVLRLEAGTRLFAEPLSLPAGAERVIDFASLGQVHVEVRDDSGGLQAEHTVILRDGSGRSQVQTTNERGETTFEHLPNGAYQLYAPRVATQGSFSRGIENAVEVRGAGVARVVISLPTLGEPRHAYLETDTGEDLHGWSARTPAAFDAVPIELDGRIRIDLARQNFRDVTIVAPDGRQWVVTLPEDPPDGHRIRLALEGPRYVGRLVNDATGTPLKGVRVSASAAQPQSRDDGNIARPSTITDRDGRFVISCEHAVAHKLHFETDSQGKATNHLEGIVFHLVREPSRQPIEFTLRLPYRREGSFQGLAQKRLGGRVQQQDTGAPVADARVWVSSRESRPSGILEIHGATVTTDAAGRYELSVVDLPSYRLSVFPPNSSSARVIEEWEGTRGVDERRDPSIP